MYLREEEWDVQMLRDEWKTSKESRCWESELMNLWIVSRCGLWFPARQDKNCTATAQDGNQVYLIMLFWQALHNYWRFARHHNITKEENNCGPERTFSLVPWEHYVLWDVYLPNEVWYKIGVSLQSSPLSLRFSLKWYITNPNGLGKWARWNQSWT